MPAWIADSRPYLDRWITDHNVDPTQLSRILEGMRLSAGCEPEEETGLQRPEVLIPELTAAPWWDTADFPWVSTLEAAAADIRMEFDAVGGLAAENAVRHPNSDNLAEAGNWNAYYFYMLGKEEPEHIKNCPKTIAALAELEGVRDSGMCYFSVMSPHTHVAAHCGFINARIRCHLGLVIPDGARMRVGEQTREWVQGKAWVFDDSFDHEVWNDNDHGRAVLLFDVWHPELTEVEKRALAYMMTVWKTFLYQESYK